jgi:hypothetical protein
MSLELNCLESNDSKLFSELVLRLKRVLFSQLKIGETYYEYYTDSRDKFIGFDGYCAIFKNNIFFAYKKCEFYKLSF